MVFVKTLQFFHVFIFHKISQQNVFDVILESKKCFKTIIKNRKLKKSKNQDFFKGVLYFRQNRPGKCVWPLERKKAFLHSKITKLKNLKVWYFSKGVGPWFWSKTLNFLHLFFLRKLGQENVFDDILERKKGFKTTKNFEIFQLFMQNRPGKCVWQYSREEKGIFRL